MKNHKECIYCKELFIPTIDNLKRVLCDNCCEVNRRLHAMETGIIRHAIFVRDDYTCMHCRTRSKPYLLHVDHVFPLSSGGGNHLHNMVTSCWKCNLGKHDWMPTDYWILLSWTKAAEGVIRNRPKIRWLAERRNVKRTFMSELYIRMRQIWLDSKSGVSIYGW